MTRIDTDDTDDTDDDRLSVIRVHPCSSVVKKISGSCDDFGRGSTATRRPPAMQRDLSDGLLRKLSARTTRAGSAQDLFFSPPSFFCPSFFWSFPSGLGFAF